MLACVKLLAMLTVDEDMLQSHTLQSKRLQSKRLQSNTLQSNLLEWVYIASHAHYLSSTRVSLHTSDQHEHFIVRGKVGLQAVQQCQISDGTTAVIKHMMSLFVTCMSCGWPV